LAGDKLAVWLARLRARWIWQNAPRQAGAEQETWTSGRLADHLADIDDDDVTLISVDVGDEQEADGLPPYVQFVTYREAMVRGEVSSNQSLAPQHALSEDGQARL